MEKTLESFSRDIETHIGRGIFKVRVKGNNSGKSGGYRLYIFVIELRKLISPLCIYSKSDLTNIRMDSLTEHLKKVQSDLNEMSDD